MVKFRLKLLEEAREFLKNVPESAHDKIMYYVDRIARGEKNKELFNKLEGLGVSDSL